MEGILFTVPRDSKEGGGHDPETDLPSRHSEPDPDVPEPDDETQDLVRPVHTAI
jgi:hypothetical protein